MRRKTKKRKNAHLAGMSMALVWRQPSDTDCTFTPMLCPSRYKASEPELSMREWGKGMVSGVILW
jgi:hypothetical protein